MSPSDAESLGLETGDKVIVSTRQGEGEATVEVSDRMMPGHMSIPNGGGLTNNLGTDKPLQRVGISANELTPVDHRDFFAGTPWHKYVPASVRIA